MARFVRGSPVWQFLRQGHVLCATSDTKPVSGPPVLLNGEYIIMLWQSVWPGGGSPQSPRNGGVYEGPN